MLLAHAGESHTTAGAETTTQTQEPTTPTNASSTKNTTPYIGISAWLAAVVILAAVYLLVNKHKSPKSKT